MLFYSFRFSLRKLCSTSNLIKPANIFALSVHTPCMILLEFFVHFLCVLLVVGAWGHLARASGADGGNGKWTVVQLLTFRFFFDLFNLEVEGLVFIQLSSFDGCMEYWNGQITIHETCMLRYSMATAAWNAAPMGSAPSSIWRCGECTWWTFPVPSSRTPTLKKAAGIFCA